MQSHREEHRSISFPLLYSVSLARVRAKRAVIRAVNARVPLSRVAADIPLAGD